MKEERARETMWEREGGRLGDRHEKQVRQKRVTIRDTELQCERERAPPGQAWHSLPDRQVSVLCRHRSFSADIL